MKAILALVLSCASAAALGSSVSASLQNTGQESTGDLIYADGLKLVGQGPRTYLLTWDAYQADPCENQTTYNVYRGQSENFEPSAATLVASGLHFRTFVSHEPSDHDYFYSVTVNLIPTSCTLHSGWIDVFPLDLGSRYNLFAGVLTDTCTAQSTTEIWCPSIRQTFHAVIADQLGHEYLIGCEDGDFNGGAWNCVDLRTGHYEVAVHNTTLTVFNGGWVEANVKTGKPIAPIVPVFSALARIK